MKSSYKGKILISTPDVSGDIFSRSVILIIEHNENGAFGLILNKMNKEMSSKLLKTLGYEVDVYEGGPVANNKIFFIIKDKNITDKKVPIDDLYYLTEDVESVIGAILDERIAIDELKVFSGYSGWSPNQLESEMNRKLWIVVDAINLDYTQANDQSLWKKIMQNLGGEYLLWINTPEDVSLN